MGRERDKRGRFTPRTENEQKVEPEECLLKQFKMWVSRNRGTLLTLFIIWLMLTGVFWLLIQKEVKTEVCRNTTYDSYDYGYINGTWHSRVAVFPWCDSVTEKKYYSFYEVVRMEFDWVVTQPGNLAEWIFQHPVI